MNSNTRHLPGESNVHSFLLCYAMPFPAQRRSKDVVRVGEANMFLDGLFPPWWPKMNTRRLLSEKRIPSQPCCCAVGSLCCWEALAVPLIIVTPVAQLSLTPSMPSVRWECCWFNVGLVNLSGELPMAAHSKHAIFRHSVLCVSLKYQQYSLMTLSHTACSTNTSGCINERNSVMPVWPPWV